MPTVRQRTFAGGELAPTLHGRDDLARYSNSLRTCKNMVVTPHGALQNRTGTTFVAETKGSATARLRAFVYSNSSVFLLSFTRQHVRVYRLGVQVAEYSTPYLAADLSKLKFSQRGAVLSITCTGYEPRDLTLLNASGSSWSLTVSPRGPYYMAPLGPWGIWVNNWVAAWAADGVPKLWSFGVTAVYADGSESLLLATTEVLVDRIEYSVEIGWNSLYVNAVRYNVYLGRGGIWGFLDSVVAKPGVSVTQYYRDTTGPQDTQNKVQAPTEGGVSGNLRVGILTPIAVQNAVNPPDFSVTAPSGRRAYKTVAVAWGSHVRYELGDRVTSGGRTYECETAGFSGVVAPSVTVGSQVDGAVTRVPSTAYILGDLIVNDGYTFICTQAGSTSADLYHPTTKTPTDGSSIWEQHGYGEQITWRLVQTGVAPAEYPAVNAYHEQRRIYGGGLACTDQPANPSRIRGSRIGAYNDFDTNQTIQGDDALDFSLSSKNYEEIRSLLSLGSLVVFTNRTVWAVNSDSGADGAITPFSVRARPQLEIGSAWLSPLVVGQTILFLQDNGRVVHSLQFNPEASSFKESVISVWATHLLEFRTIVDWAYAQQPSGVVWSVCSDGVLLGLTYLPEYEVAAWHQHETDGAFESVCTLPENGEDSVYVVVRRTIGGATRRYIEKFSTRLIPRLFTGVADAAKWIFLDSAVQYSNTAYATVLTGLSHLEGKTVGVLADGNVLTPRVVVSGQISIIDEMPDGARVITAGLGFTSIVETLDMTSPEVELHTKQKAVTEVGLEVLDTRGVEIGTSLTNLRPYRQRQVRDSYGAVAVFSGLIKIALGTCYDYSSGVVVRQSDPLSLTILGLSREIALGGD